MIQRLGRPFTTIAAGLCLAAPGCSADPPPPTSEERSALLVDELAQEAIAPKVTICVGQLAEDRFRYGDLSEIALAEMIESCTDAQRELDEFEAGAEPPETIAFAVPVVRGDIPKLDELWDSCADGDGAACDTLFDQAPPGSEYEEFGLSCGQREYILHCSELDDENQDEG